MRTESLWAFPESYIADDSQIMRSSDGGQWGDKVHHQGEFLYNYCKFVSLHDSDHEGVVRIFVALSCEI